MNFSHLIYDTWRDVKLLITQLTIDYYSSLKFKYKNLNVTQQVNSKDAKSYHKFCTFSALRQLIIVLTSVTSRSSRITDHHYPERIVQSGVIDIGLSSHQLNYYTIRTFIIKRE